MMASIAVLSPILGTTLAVLCTIVFVGALYVGPIQGHRDNPRVIAQRIVAVTIAAIVTIVISIVALDTPSLSSSTSWSIKWHSIRPILGLSLGPNTLLESFILPTLLTLSLFIGSLFDHILRSIRRRRRHQSNQIHNNPRSNRNVVVDDDDDDDNFFDEDALVMVRNYIVGPLTEEIVFRCCIVALLKATFASDIIIIIISAILFGAAHIHHHIADFYAGRESLSTAAAHATLQFTFTAAFGSYASLLLLRTNSLIAPLAAHIVCNVFGLPRVSGVSNMVIAIHFAGVAIFATGVITLARSH